MIELVLSSQQAESLKIARFTGFLFPAENGSGILVNIKEVGSGWQRRQTKYYGKELTGRTDKN